jgi:cytochrome c oxidase assembly protein subunit 15
MHADSLPTLRNRQVATWLLIMCGLVFAMVVLGGVTRLTGSGLSMVDWRPIMGWLPPLSAEQWQAAFELYQQSPEFQKINSHMDVNDFKGIFWLEYLHRLLGRTIGLAFAIPFVVFVARGYIGRREWPRYLLMFVLGGLQGVLGWYMVKSGLLVTALISLTIVSGGFVAGLDAGMIYNTFPKMGATWLPPGLLALDPWWRNAFENMTTVQFDHRMLALLTLAVIVFYWQKARRADLPARSRRAANALLHTAVLQVVLGVSTLLLSVPIVLAASHQAVALLLFTVALYLAHSLRTAKSS